jgi:hypothetical protein
MPEVTRRDILRGGLLAATAVFTSKVFGDAPAAFAAADGYAVAYNHLDITPQVSKGWGSLWMGGYGWDPRGASPDPNVNHVPHRPLTAHCLAIHDGGSKNVILRLDVVSIPRDVHLEIRRRVVDELGLVGDSDFMIVSSHTHSGPFIGDTHPDPVVIMGLAPADVDAINNSTWMFIGLVVELVKRTVEEAPIPAKLAYAETTADIGNNRCGLPEVIDVVPVLTVRAASDDTLLCILFGAAAHPVCRKRDNVFDSEYCGAAAEFIEQRLGAMAFFFLGTAGDQEAYHDDSVDQPAVLGARLADAVVDLVENGQFDAVTGPISTELIEVTLPFWIDNDDPDNVAVLRQKYVERTHGPNTPGWDGYAELRHARIMIEKIDNGTLESNVPMPIQCWKFGSGLTILALAHEVVGIYHVLIKEYAEQIGTGNLWIMGYANEVQCYVPSDQLLWAGEDIRYGYEAGWNQGDEWIAGYGSGQLAYGWPSPFRPSPPGTHPASPDSTESIVLTACEGLLR